MSELNCTLPAKMDLKIILAIAQAAEQEEGMSNIHMIGKKRTWHRCVWSYRKRTLFLYNDNSHSTKSITIRQGKG